MRVPDYSKRILALAELLHRWVGQLMKLDAVRREKVARYAEEIAATLARAADAHHKLEAEPGHGPSQRALVREFGRISGYLETIVGVLHRHLDGRKLAGVKRRLEQLRPADPGVAPPTLPHVTAPQAAADRLTAAEGYFRALADALRA
ncbi:MAG: hypothetical protein C0519_00070 [Hyphomicrobium sp.]|jgi:hypothetical protein|nr:hypothetical protein [Hyphomicrobium sp.]PPD08143.1 MAG: hypothetical protein CTY28_07490 [Hyphomicrobium sp.]